MALIAHASGFSWDEGILILGPLAVIAGLLAVASRRAKASGGLDEPVPVPERDTGRPG
jgi:hypothetical protein